jgi:hypothetical protein
MYPSDQEIFLLNKLFEAECVLRSSNGVEHSYALFAQIIQNESIMKIIYLSIHPSIRKPSYLSRYCSVHFWQTFLWDDSR